MDAFQVRRQRGATTTRVIHLDELRMQDWIPAGAMVVWGQAGAEPTTLTAALMRDRHAIGGFRAGIGLTLSDTASPEFGDVVRFISYCASANNRRLAAAGLLDILPLPYSQFAAALEPVDVLMLHLPPADARGRHSLGLVQEYLLPLIETARIVVAEINDQMPNVFGAVTIATDELDGVIHTSHPLLELPPIKPGPVERHVARNVASLIEDGATLQLGLGQIPEAVLDALRKHHDLGIHSGVIGDGVAELMEAGVITNARKSINTGVSVAGWLLGSHRLYDFARENPALLVCGTGYTHDPGVLANVNKLAAINSAIEVDLTGQINAETVGSHYVGGVGGAAEFIRGAHRSPGGLPIVALPSTVAKSGKSRIVARLSGPISTPRSEAGLIVTEHGVADLRGRSLRERRKLMLAIAAPQWRETLEKAASTENADC
ncbi:acetyl-CoA hydrolase/transferase family protein [Rhizobium puerariae]|uniref:Acetyl-CoA hydrolase/transferase family protein n=1 Tax=Rhizobium puerariae TaxID=1585791 RepID=A0ABV6AML9_9HYPH